MAFLSGLAAKLIQWGIKKLAPIIIAGFKNLVANAKINRETNAEVKSVREAVEAADKALKDCEALDAKECRVPSEEEKKLRDATRRLSTSIFG